ncbi:kazrin-like [Huso huso]|uniref:Kazrin-like n=1 Tax=Huso huso TaxID=61971 RepID=A0ABR0YYF4_HUSHU
MVNGPKALNDEDDTFLPSEKETLKKSMTLMRQLLMDAQAKILKMMDDNKQLALRIDGAIQSASQEVTNLRSELTATSRRLAEISASEPTTIMENNQHNTQGEEEFFFSVFFFFLMQSLYFKVFCVCL